MFCLRSMNTYWLGRTFVGYLLPIFLVFCVVFLVLFLVVLCLVSLSYPLLIAPLVLSNVSVIMLGGWSLVSCGISKWTQNCIWFPNCQCLCWISNWITKIKYQHTVYIEERSSTIIPINDMFVSNLRVIVHAEYSTARNWSWH